MSDVPNIFPFYCGSCVRRFGTQDGLDRHMKSKDHYFDSKSLADEFLEATSQPWDPALELEDSAGHEYHLNTDLFQDHSETSSKNKTLWLDGETHGDGMREEYQEWLEDPSREDRKAIHDLTQPSRINSLKIELSRPTISETLFTYDSLTDIEDTFRLLVLWPSNNSKDPLECGLFQTSLATQLEYHALSYSWGTEPHLLMPIALNGKLFYVTARLYEALIMLRSPLHPILLWIDAICINQNNHPEANTQVLFMSSIYGKAKSVIIWLGSADDYAAWWITTCEARHVFFDLSRREMKALHGFINRSWFRRMWVIQEFVLARQVNFVLGPYAFSEDRLLVALNLLNQNIAFRPTTSSDVIEVDDTGIKILHITKLFSYRKRTTQPPFPQLLEYFRRFKATRPQDKIYGLLGLAAAQGVLLDLFPRPDYDKPCMDVFRDWNLYFFELYKDVSVLCSCRASPEDVAYPSWVPDWRQRRSTRCYFPLASYLSDCNASKDFQIRYKITDNLKELCLHGILLAALTMDCLSGDASSTSIHLNHIRGEKGSRYISSHTGLSVNSRAESPEVQTSNVYNYRTWCQLQDGRSALIPKNVKAGDIICIIFGGSTPIILRPFQVTPAKDGHYEYIGDCYLDDCMDGEECYEFDSVGKSRV